VRLLIIEDDEVVASYVKSGLEQAGYTVDAAANGKDGLFLATTVGPVSPGRRESDPSAVLPPRAGFSAARPEYLPLRNPL
jgi:CheY-like chemotaxis protein